MKIVEIASNQLREAPWNPNQMSDSIRDRLQQSLSRYGLVEPLVVRPMGDSFFEVLSGNQRLHSLREMDTPVVPCVLVELDDHEAMLLAQALNGLRGEDDLGLKSALLQKILSAIPQEEVLSLLPETSQSLQELSSLGQADLAAHLQAWDEAQAARLKHMQLQFTQSQLEVVQEAVERILPEVRSSSEENPNNRGNAIYLLSRFYLQKVGPE